MNVDVTNMLDEMPILEKTDTLEQLIERAEFDVEYAIKVIWNAEVTDSKKDAKIIIENIRTLFNDNEINKMEGLERNEAFDKLNKLLDSHLMQFPEYRIKYERKY